MSPPPATPAGHVPDLRARVEGLSLWYASISPASLAELNQWYTPDARFKDPFNDVRGVDAIRRIFEHMFHSLHEPRFVVTRHIVDGQHAFLVWEFRFRFKRFDTVTEQVVHGGSHITLTPDGLVSEHRDYWDAAEELYEKLPLLGGFMRWIKRRANS